MHHNVISDALTILERRPRRWLSSVFLRRYSLLLALSITFIMAASAGPYAPKWTALWILLYWLYYFQKRRLGQLGHLWGTPYHSSTVQFGRSALLVVCVIIFLAYLYLGTDYLRLQGDRDTLWLLLLLAIFVMSQYGITELMVIIVALASFGLILLYMLFYPRWDVALVQHITFKISWLGLLAFILHVLLRFIRDWFASLRLLHKVVGEQLIQISTSSEERQLLDFLVRRIATDFDYPHVNILYLQSDGHLQYVAGACLAGRVLAEEGYILKSNRGIIKHVALAGETYIANNVKKDPFYTSAPAFPKTQAELAVPIKLGRKVIGILDIQAHRKNVFLPEDQEVMEIMANHLAKALDNIKLLRSRQQISQIVESIAKRFLSQHELKSTLDQITQVAYEELKADIVVLYERNPVTNKIIGPVCAGKLYEPDHFNLTVLEPDSLVYRLLAAPEAFCFHEDVNDFPEASLFAPTEYHRRCNVATFEVREQVRSRTIICLCTDTDRVGLLFLNFRTPRRFDEREREMFFIFAHLAALAIQKAQSHQQALQHERENLARQLHDQLIATADGLVHSRI